MTKNEIKARNMITNQTLAELFDEWELTGKINTPEIAIVRGWLMDEFEKRNPEAFNKWLDSEECLDEELKDYMTK